MLLPNGWPLSCGRHEAYHGRPTPGNPDRHRGSVALTRSAVSFSGLLGRSLPSCARPEPNQGWTDEGRDEVGGEEDRPQPGDGRVQPATGTEPEVGNDERPVKSDEPRAADKRLETEDASPRRKNPARNRTQRVVAVRPGPPRRRKACG